MDKKERPLTKWEQFLVDAAMGYDELGKQGFSGGTTAERLKQKYRQFKYLPQEEYIKHLKNLVTSDRQEGFGGKRAFFEWVVRQPRECCYCGVREEQTYRFFNELFKKGIKTKNNRGRFFEVERKDSAKGYCKDNCALACYVCNNAKSNFLSEEDFKIIARGITEFWKKQK